MQQIEKFRDSHTLLFGESNIETEDPYTKRVIEALAFFSARARQQGARKIVQLHQCLFRQYFPYLVNPLPALGMMQIKPSIKFPETVDFSAGSELVFKTNDGQKATFQTLDALSIYPIFVKKCDFQRRKDGGWRCLLEYSSPHIRTEELKSIKFHINHLNSFIPSLSLFMALQYSLENVQVFYDQSGKPEDGKACRFHFENQEDRRNYNHIVEQLRLKLHFPQQELFISLEIPPAGKRWQSITFCFDFDSKWPDTLKLTTDSFLPFVVPIINLKLGHAEPLVVDATKDSHAVLYPEPTHKFELQKVVNVQEILSTGSKPIKPGLMAIEGSSYDVDYFTKRIVIHLPGAFNAPKTISVLALWSQPWFSDYLNEEFEMQFPEAETFGLDVKLLGFFHRHENTLENDPDILIRILSLKNQNFLSLHEILFIVNTMKNFKTSYFDMVPEYIKELKVNKKVNQKNITNVLEYEFFLKELGGQKQELYFLFFVYVNELLNCWLANYEVETKVHFPRHKRPLIIKQGTNNELSTLARNFFLS